jgi:nucleoside-diphosphate-sugar epimerase
VVGPRDPTNRFDYWVAKKAQAGEFEVPSSPDQPVQWIDVRDLAAWTVRAIEERLTGAYHLVMPPTTMGAWLEALPGPGRPAWVQLEEEQAEEFPFYLGPEDRYIFALDPARAIAAGLTFRSLAETLGD